MEQCPVPAGKGEQIVPIEVKADVNLKAKVSKPSGTDSILRPSVLQRQIIREKTGLSISPSMRWRKSAAGSHMCRSKAECNLSTSQSAQISASPPSAHPLSEHFPQGFPL